MAFELGTDERIVREERAAWLKNKLSLKGGKLILTNQRFVFISDKANIFGLIGALLKYGQGKGPTVFDLTKSQIAGVEKSKYGRNDNVLMVKTSSDEEFKIALRSSHDEWVAAVSQLGSAA